MTSCKQYAVALIILALGFTNTHMAQEKVSVSQKEMSFDFITAETATRSTRSKAPEQRKPGHYPIRNSKKTIKKNTNVIILDNGIVEAWITPAWGARLIRAIDKKTGQDYFKWWGFVVEDHLGWTKPGGVKASFPFFEHGLHTSQPATYRILQHPDGSATVAMQLRFTQFQTTAAMERYGRFGDEPMFIMVTLRPGSSIVEWHQRKENPTPMPRAERFWNDACFPTAFAEKTKEEYTKRELKRFEKNGRVAYHRGRSGKLTHYIYPMRYVADHGPNVVHSSPHWSNPDNWNISHFGIDAPYGFVGVWTQPNDTSYLRINDPETAPAAKLYTCDYDTFLEHWGGVGHVFETPGKLYPAYRPVEFTHRFYIAQGLGSPAEFANDDVAVAIDEENKTFSMIATRTGKATVKDGTGSIVASGDIAPHTVLKGQFDGKQLIVEMDGREVLNQSFPLDRPTPGKGEKIPAEVQKLFKEIVASHGPEGETVAAHDQGKKGATAGIKDNPRVAYRFGHLDKALELLGDKHDPASDYLRGLIAWEKGEKVDFGKADWRADYHRALSAKQAGDTEAAINFINQYLKEIPTAWRPRLAKAYWSKDLKAAKALSAENPASPEALLVIKLLGDDSVNQDLVSLMKEDKETTADVNRFKAEITEGKWAHPTRYKPAQPK